MRMHVGGIGGGVVVVVVGDITPSNCNTIRDVTLGNVLLEAKAGPSLIGFGQAINSRK